MSTDVSDAGTVVSFGAEDLKANAELYRKHSRLVDAVASGMTGAKPKYDSLDDAWSQLSEVFEVLRAQVDNGVGYTPSRDLGFGSDNASQIAEALIGLRQTVGSTRTAFRKLGA